MPDTALPIHVLAVVADPKELPFVESAMDRFKNGFPPVRITALLFEKMTSIKEFAIPWADRVLTDKGGLSGANHTAPDEQRKSLLSLVEDIKTLLCDAAIIFTSPGQSPYSAAYLCYLAGIPVRIGHSIEFGGGVLTHWVKALPEKDPVSRHLSLLRLIDSSRAGATPAL